MKENEYNWMLSAIIQAQNDTHIFFLIYRHLTWVWESGGQGAQEKEDYERRNRNLNGEEVYMHGIKKEGGDC